MVLTSQPTKLSCASRTKAPNTTRRASYEIGLVNNMSGTALHTTTKQFWSLLEEAGEDANIHLRIYSPFADPRILSRERALFKNYEHIENLWTSKLDGMIVSGTEPKAARLVDEPSWPFLTQLVDWSEDNVLSTVWSCMATQAAVFHLDGVERQARATKLSGVFGCEVSADNQMLDGYPRRWSVAHSRYNDLPETVLAAHGYEILARSPVAGADTFMKHRKIPHFFLQGHMEYDGDALAREYRRDVRRFLVAETDRFPETPVAYFAADVEHALVDFREKALRTRDLKLLAEFPVRIPATCKRASWRSVAVQFYRNWLAHLANCKATNAETISGDTRALRHAAPERPL
ncbi:MAG: homoserine O-succinyltransferase [Rhizomicrobium sp.]